MSLTQPVKLLTSHGLLIVKDIDSYSEYEYELISIFIHDYFFSIQNYPWNETQEKNGEWGISECVLC